jgi:hypothetical protein
MRRAAWLRNSSAPGADRIVPGCSLRTSGGGSRVGQARRLATTASSNPPGCHSGNASGRQESSAGFDSRRLHLHRLQGASMRAAGIFHSSSPSTSRSVAERSPAVPSSSSAARGEGASAAADREGSRHPAISRSLALSEVLSNRAQIEVHEIPERHPATPEDRGVGKTKTLRLYLRLIYLLVMQGCRLSAFRVASAALRLGWQVRYSNSEYRTSEGNAARCGER